ncbi:MAG: radical SAM protein [Candidatus Omnitrophota bacterium]
MQKQNRSVFSQKLFNKKPHLPLEGLLELTYCCNLNCLHCYCQGYQNKDGELSTQEWKQLLRIIHKEGVLFLTLSGGEPLLRKDFLEIYAFAKRLGFIITLFSNGQGFTENIIRHLEKSPPSHIEITLNGITKATYEAVTGMEGSFPRVMENIKKLAERKLPLIIKSNCLKQNKQEIAKIKTFTEQLLGKPHKKLHRFKYDPMIYPRLNGDKEPVNFRLSFKELLAVKRQDEDFWEEYQRGLHSDFPKLKRDRNFLYRCDAWMNHFVINPYGRLKFCIFSDKFSVDMKTVSFKEGFYRVFPRLLNERFKTNSQCKDCRLRPICYHCPARAFLETGDEEAPVPYYCELAEALAKEMECASRI